MTITLTSKDIVGARFYSNATQMILQLLKERGAPIDGEFFLTMRDGYTATRRENPEDGSITFTFKKSSPRSK